MHIPSTCPALFSNIMKACWATDPHNRPSFSELIKSLERISHSQFVHTHDNSFHTMQEKWKVEIEEMVEELKCKEKELRSREGHVIEREEQLSKALLQQKVYEEELKRREKELAEREIDVLGRELNMIILQQQQISRPEPRKRRGKFKKNKLIKLLKVHSNTNQQLISMPSDFRHNITVLQEPVTLTKQQSTISTPESPPSSPSLPRLRAYALSQNTTKGKTWGPSTLNHRERVQLPQQKVPVLENGKIKCSKSAPNLEKGKNNSTFYYFGSTALGEMSM